MKTRNLLIPIILTQALNAHAFEEPVREVSQAVKSASEKFLEACGGDKPTELSKLQKKSNSILRELGHQLNTARIKTGWEGSASFSDRSSLYIGYGIESDTSIGGKFSGVDKWKINIPFLLYGSKALDLGISATRELTFIQQFNSRLGTLCRVPYDPVTKVPTSSAVFLEKRLKEGDFVAYSSPLTLFAGKNWESFIPSTSLHKALGGASIFLTGEFDIHVYVMKNNHVRVRFFASKTDGVSLSVGPKFYVFGGLLGVAPFNIDLATADSDLFSADYIFDLNQKEARDQYDQVMGQKFDLTKIVTVIPGQSGNTIQRQVYGDLQSLNAMALNDSTKPLDQRGVIRLGRGDTTSRSSYQGISGDLKFVDFKMGDTYADTKVSRVNVDNQGSKFRIQTITRERKAKLIQVYGARDVHNTALLLETDNNYNPVATTGLQSIRTVDSSNFTTADMIKLKQRLQKNLPYEISSKLVLPDTDHLKVTGATIEQSMYLDTKKIQSQKSITVSRIQTKLTELIQNWGSIEAPPMSVQNLGDKKDPREVSKYDGDMKLSHGKDHRKDYMDAYSYEMSYISSNLANLFSEASMDKKLESYNLLQGIPLFNELGMTLVLNLISENQQGNPIKMEEIVAYRLTISGSGIKSSVTEYPVVSQETSDLIKTSIKNMDVFRRILNDTAFMGDRSFNLRYYMNENGEALSLKEVYDRSK